MSILKRCISIFAVLAFVMTTMPMVSHGSSVHDAKASVEKSENTVKKSHPDCHGHGDKKSGANKDNAPNKDHNKKSCCDKVCKCIGGTCHPNAKVFGNNGIHFIHPQTTKNIVMTEQMIVVSDLHSRIKRPPKS